MAPHETLVLTNGSERMVYQLTGAQVLQFECAGRPLAYVSPLGDGPGKTVRGGLPVLFPQFGDRGPLRKHGWARDVAWALVREEATEAGCSLEMQLNVAQNDYSDWPHSARLTLHVHLDRSSLEMTLRVLNTGSTAFDWAGGLHPYWATSDVLRSELLGLEGIRVQDRYQSDRTVESGQSVVWTGAPCERLYEGKASLTFRTPYHTLGLSMTGFDQWMVWNPGESGAAAIPDLPDSDWKQFVCIEPVLVDRRSVLKPGDAFEGSLRVVILP
ncbi:MAG: hypothetical protein RLY30_864 [Pseudomonadota bacterium]|jgi:glucose-6-phosphate 1-epimerase